MFRTVSLAVVAALMASPAVAVNAPAADPLLKFSGEVTRISPSHFQECGLGDCAVGRAFGGSF